MRLVYLTIISSLIMLGSCTTLTVVKTNPNGKVPPGQMKKATGAQSAKAYAPGQQKKAVGQQNASGQKTPPGQQKKK